VNETTVNAYIAPKRLQILTSNKKA